MVREREGKRVCECARACNRERASERTGERAGERERDSRGDRGTEKEKRVPANKKRAAMHSLYSLDINTRQRARNQPRLHRQLLPNDTDTHTRSLAHCDKAEEGAERRMEGVGERERERGGYGREKERKKEP